MLHFIAFLSVTIRGLQHQVYVVRGLLTQKDINIYSIYPQKAITVQDEEVTDTTHALKSSYQLDTTQLQVIYHQ